MNVCVHAGTREKSIAKGRVGVAKVDHCEETTNEGCVCSNTVETKKSKRKGTAMVITMLGMTIDVQKSEAR